MKYHKINAPYKRNMDVKSKPLILGDWSVPEFDLLQVVQWDAYEKIDGTNIRINFNGEQTTFEGRTDKAIIPPHLLNYLENHFTSERMGEEFPDLLKNFPDMVTLYGEGYGHKIQTGGIYLPNKEVGFILFDIRVGKWWLTKDVVKSIAESLNIPTVPKVATGNLQTLIRLVGDGLKSTFGDFFAEGIVTTPKLDLFSRSGDRIITKIKHKDFYKGSM